MVKTEQIENKEFEERSDYLDESDLLNWNVSNDYFINIQRELLGPGSRLLMGPRGTGKTHQMRIAHQKCVKEESKPVAIFVSLNKYFYLEPLLTKAPNAIQLFHTWVLCKIYIGCYSFLKACGKEVQILDDNENILLSNLKEFESKAESPYSSQLDNDTLIQKLNIGKIISLIETVMSITSRQRALIFLDDAALTLTPDYFVEFLDIFRSLKTKVIAPKASVYPGTTQYSPRFHVGHDAQFTECWMGVENEKYSEFMESIIDTRLSSHKRIINRDVLELMKYASFGIPRILISLIRSFQNSSSKEKTIQARFNSIIDQRAKLIEAEYLSLKEKIPQYDNVIQIGWDFFKKLTNDLKEENKTLSNEKNFVVGIPDDDKIKMSLRMIGFLREAGLVYEEDSSVKHGNHREYKRYIPHLMFLLENRTFSKDRGFNAQEILSAIRAKPKKHPLRRSFSALLGSNAIKLKLNLPTCQECSAPRLAEEQKFCHNCGNQLVNKSAFEHCLNMNIDDLPLTYWQKEKIKRIQIETIGDFLSLSNPGGELRKIKGIGKVKSEQIAIKIQDTVKEMLDRTLTDFLS